MPAYEGIHEVDFDGEFGNLMGFHLRGHGHDPDDIDRYLDELAYENGYDEQFPVEWEVREDWVRKVPVRPAGGHRFVYTGKPARGAAAVTVIERPWGWEHWCVHHPLERAMTGIPVGRISDGEAFVARRLAELADEIDPRRDVDDRNGGTVYYCRPCARDFDARWQAAITTARAEALAGREAS